MSTLAISHRCLFLQKVPVSPSLNCSNYVALVFLLNFSFLLKRETQIFLSTRKMFFSFCMSLCLAIVLVVAFLVIVSGKKIIALLHPAMIRISAIRMTVGTVINFLHANLQSLTIQSSCIIAAFSDRRYLPILVMARNVWIYHCRPISTHKPRSTCHRSRQLIYPTFDIWVLAQIILSL